MRAIKRVCGVADQEIDQGEPLTRLPTVLLSKVFSTLTVCEHAFLACASRTLHRVSRLVASSPWHVRMPDCLERSTARRIHEVAAAFAPRALTTTYNPHDTDALEAIARMTSLHTLDVHVDFSRLDSMRPLQTLQSLTSLDIHCWCRKGTVARAPNMQLPATLRRLKISDLYVSDFAGIPDGVQELRIGSVSANSWNHESDGGERFERALREDRAHAAALFTRLSQLRTLELDCNGWIGARIATAAALAHSQSLVSLCGSAVSDEDCMARSLACVRLRKLRVQLRTNKLARDVAASCAALECLDLSEYSRHARDVPSELCAVPEHWSATSNLHTLVMRNCALDTAFLAKQLARLLPERLRRNLTHLDLSYNHALHDFRELEVFVGLRALVIGACNVWPVDLASARRRGDCVTTPCRPRVLSLDSACEWKLPFPYTHMDHGGLSDDQLDDQLDEMDCLDHAIACPLRLPELVLPRLPALETLLYLGSWGAMAYPLAQLANLFPALTALAPCAARCEGVLEALAQLPRLVRLDASELSPAEFKRFKAHHAQRLPRVHVHVARWSPHDDLWRPTETF